MCAVVTNTPSYFTTRQPTVTLDTTRDVYFFRLETFLAVLGFLQRVPLLPSDVLPRLPRASDAPRTGHLGDACCHLWVRKLTERCNAQEKLRARRNTCARCGQGERGHDGAGVGRRPTSVGE
eukprot:5701777-Prymnesium_polylepis.2